MYDKIYKEIFLKNYVLRKKMVFLYPPDDDINKNRSIWEVIVFEKKYYITVYLDDIEEYVFLEELKDKRYEKRNEAELTHFSANYGEKPTEKRIIANRLFLELLRKYAKEAKELQNL